MLRFVRLTVLLLLLSALPASAQALRNDLWVTNGPVYASAVINNTLYLGGAFGSIGPATGGFVQTLATTGQMTSVAPNVDGQVNAIASDGAGGWYVGGAFLHFQGQPRASLAHVDGDGNLLPWNPGCNGTVKTMALSGGALYIGGLFSQVGGQARGNLAAVDASTGALLGWNPGADNIVHAIQVLSGLVYVGGGFLNIAGVSRSGLAALDVNTGAASNWQPSPNGGIYALNARTNALGGNTFVYIGGTFSSVGGASRSFLASIDATPGSANFGQATSFNPAPNGPVHTIILTGLTLINVYVGGEFTFIAGQFRSRLASFSGSTLTSWDPNANGTVLTINLRGTNMYVGGNFGALRGMPRDSAGSVALSDGALAGWSPKPNAPVNAIAATDSTVWIGGDMTSVGAVGRSNLAAIDLATGMATAWNPVADNTVYALEAVNGVLYAGGAFLFVGGEFRPHAAVVDTNGIVGTWTPAPAGGNVKAIVAAPDPNDPSGTVIYLGGTFTSVRSVTRNYLAKVSSSGESPTIYDWDPKVDGDEVSALAYDPGSNLVYVGGSFYFLNGQVRENIAQIDALGNATPNWHPGVSSQVSTIRLSGGRVYVGFGGLGVVGGQSRIGIAALSPNSNQPLPWNPGCNGTVLSILPTASTVFLGGLFNQVGGQPRWNIAEVDIASAAVTSFNAPTWSWLPASSGPIVNDLVAGGGTLYAAGFFKSILGMPHSGIAAISLGTVDVVPDARVTGIALRALPNPASAGQTIAFTLPAAAPTRVEVLNVAGRLVRVLHDGLLPAGSRSLTWDGLGESGARVSPGLYFVRLSAGGAPATLKLMRF